MATQSQTENLSLSQHIVYICSRFIAYSLPLFFFLIINSFYLKTYDSAQIKITITQMGATALAFAWLVKILVQGRLPFTRKDIVYVLPFLAFLASGLIVWLHSPFKGWSLEETLRRVYYMIVAIVTIAEIRSNERMTRMWRWLIAAACLSMGYGLLQYIDLRFFSPPAPGLDPFIWRGAFGPRVFSTFGNPNFYGNFLVIMTPIVLASVLREKGNIARPFIVLLITAALVFTIDKLTIGLFGGYDQSFRIVFQALIAGFLGLFIYACTAKVGSNVTLPFYLMLFAVLFLNLYSTETKGAWMGFIAAIAISVLLIFEYFLHFEDILVEAKKYLAYVFVLALVMVSSLVAMVYAFVIPWLKGAVGQIGFQILWIPTLLFAIVSAVTIFLLLRKPWNLKKMIYGLLVVFMVVMGGIVLQFAKTRLVSVSFRMFTWISTWEMIESNPILGNGVGTFKIIYPAFRRPEIIVLEGRSNTETDHSEDEYLEIWQDEGIVGFGIFIWMMLTALVLGFKQLRWYTTHRSQDGPNQRAYEVLGYLGAYIGALIHWFVDVSVRFVSSGVFSGLLPGILVAYARNHQDPVENEVRLPYDYLIRAGLAAFWTSILLWLGVELVPQTMIQGGDTTKGQIWFWAILLGIALYGLIELLERGNLPTKKVLFKESYGDINPKYFMQRLFLLPVVFLIFFTGMTFAANHFWGDVHHNLAIFFSKEGVWLKSPNYDAKIMTFPPDIRKKYQQTGGALDHYREVNKKNKSFPMAYYFTGNVFNDWGSQVHNDSLSMLNKGDRDEALRLKEKAIDMWSKSEQSYSDTKKLAPNYVQTHHQMGLLNVKRAEQASSWGDIALSKKFYEEALKNFYLYKMLDPVFPPNYDRIVQILLMEGKVDQAIKEYKEALHNNDVLAKTIHKSGFKDRIASISISLAKIYFNQIANVPNAFSFSSPAPQVEESIKYFKIATENDPNNLEAWKGLGFLLEKTGRVSEAQAAYQQALRLAPNDPQLQTK